MRISYTEVFERLSNITKILCIKIARAAAKELKEER